MTMRYQLREMEKDTIKNPQKYTVEERTVDPLMMLVDVAGASNMEVHLEGININKQLPCDLAVPLIRAYEEKTRLGRKPCTQAGTAAALQQQRHGSK